MKDFSTFHELLEMISSSYSIQAALSSRMNDKWVTLSTQEFYEQTKRLALGLSRLGVNNGDTVGIMGHPSQLWITADLAIMSIGAVTVPIFPDEPEETRSYKIADAGIDTLFLLDEQACIEAEPHIGKLTRLISLANGAQYTHFSQVLGLGTVEDDKNPNRFAEIGKSISADDLSTIYYTSGSTGHPKGVELSHANIVSQIKAASEHIPLMAGDVALSCLPLAHSFERFMVYYYLASGVPVYFNTDIHVLADDLRDVSPTVLSMVPRIFEKLYEKFHVNLEQSSPFKRCIGRMAEKWAFEIEPGSGLRCLKGMIAQALVFRKLRSALGGGLRVVITGGAAMPPDLYRFFVNAGVPVLQGYGMTEASPVLSANSPSAHEIGTVGTAFPGVEIRITSEGEITAKGPNIMKRYHNLPAETREAIDKEGWLHTGDLGRIDNGFLTITGRKKELIKTSSGEYVAPLAIEQALLKSPLIDMTMILGEGRPFVTCLIFPVSELGEADIEEIDRVVEELNCSLEHWEQIRQYWIVPDTLSVENGMLTPTMKIRRHQVLKKYSDLIERMYNMSHEDIDDLERRAS